MHLPIAAEAELRRRLSRHPNTKQHISDRAEIEFLPKAQLLKLARRLTVDVKAIVEHAKENSEGFKGLYDHDDMARYEHSQEWPGFVGKLLFPLSMNMMGRGFTRQARAQYSYTPEWEYYDLKLQRPHVGWAGSRIGLAVRAARADDHAGLRAGKKKRRERGAWIDIDLVGRGVLPESVWDLIFAAIEDRCLLEDKLRRERFAAKGRVAWKVPVHAPRRDCNQPNFGD